MPLYYFDVHDGDQSSHDDEGVHLADLAAARVEAQRLLPDLVRHDVENNADRKSYVVLVTDEDRQPVYSATLNFTGLWLRL